MILIGRKRIVCRTFIISIEFSYFLLEKDQFSIENLLFPLVTIKYFYCKFIIFIGHLLFFIEGKRIFKWKMTNFLLDIYYFY